MPSRIPLFLRPLPWFLCPLFMAAWVFAASPSSPVNSLFTEQTSAEVLNDPQHTMRYTLSLIEGSRTLWTHPSPGFVVRLISRADLDLFLFEFDTGSGGQIRAYHKNGKLIFQKNVRSVVLSPDGQTLAYLQTLPKGPGEELVISRMGKKREVSFAVPPDTVPKAVSPGGKIVLLADERDPKHSTLWTVTDKGTKLWSRSGNLGFLTIQERPLEVLLLTSMDKMVQYVDLRSGKTQRSLPTWKYQMLTHQQVLRH